MRKFLFAICCAGMIGCFSGCPDTAHLRDAPDYSSQKDPDGGDETKTVTRKSPTDEEADRGKEREEE